MRFFRIFPQLWGKHQEIFAQPPISAHCHPLICWKMWLTWYSGQWPLARNPDWSCWHCHTSLKLFGRSPRFHGEQVYINQFLFPLILVLNFYLENWVCNASAPHSLDLFQSFRTLHLLPTSSRAYTIFGLGVSFIHSTEINSYHFICTFSSVTSVIVSYTSLILLISVFPCRIYQNQVNCKYLIQMKKLNPW